MTVILLLKTCSSRRCHGETVCNASIAAIAAIAGFGARGVATTWPMVDSSNTGITAIDCIAGDGVEC
jgi:hypothetical protein